MGAKSEELSKGYNLESMQEEALFASLKKTIFFLPKILTRNHFSTLLI